MFAQENVSHIHSNMRKNVQYVKLTECSLEVRQRTLSQPMHIAQSDQGHSLYINTVERRY